jgi:hypothetical protein
VLDLISTLDVLSLTSPIDVPPDSSAMEKGRDQVDMRKKWNLVASID